MENRYKLPKGIQKKYLLYVERISGLSGDKLASQFSVVGRSYRDWRREKFSLPKKAVEIIERKYKLKFPYSKEQALRRWKKAKLIASQKGGTATIRKYGSPGTPEGRKLGGIRGLAVLRAKGLIPKPKKFFGPKKYSKELAEFIGILLGDGHVDKEQWTITLNSNVDRKYADFVVKRIENLFKFKPSVYKRKNMNVLIICGSGIRSIEYFHSLGLKTGNKVKQQIGVPSWIMQNQIFQTFCLRGLMDTDGGIFTHKYKVNKKLYRYKKLCFVNRSMPLLYFAYGILKTLNFSPKIITKVENKRVWLYNQREVIRYLEVVGTSNPRLQKHFQGGLPEW